MRNWDIVSEKALPFEGRLGKVGETDRSESDPGVTKPEKTNQNDSDRLKSNLEKWTNPGKPIGVQSGEQSGNDVKFSWIGLRSVIRIGFPELDSDLSESFQSLIPGCFTLSGWILLLLYSTIITICLSNLVNLCSTLSLSCWSAYGVGWFLFLWPRYSSTGISVMDSLIIEVELLSYLVHLTNPRVL